MVEHLSAKDGLGIIEMPAVANAKGMQIKTEYMFEGESNIDNELAEVMQSVNPIPMRNCYLKLEGDEPKPGESASEKPLQAVSGDSAKQTESAMHYLADEATTIYQNTIDEVEKQSALRTIRTYNPYARRKVFPCSINLSNMAMPK